MTKRFMINDVEKSFEKIPDFYSYCIKLVTDQYGLEELENLLPFGSNSKSSNRYAISKTPIHKDGSPFTTKHEVIPGIYIDSHIAWDGANRRMEQLLKEFGIKIQML